MRKIWPPEDSAKFKFQNRSENQFKIQNRTQIGLGGNFPAQGTQVDWVVDLGVDWVVDLAPKPGQTQPLLAGLVCAWPNF